MKQHWISLALAGLIAAGASWADSGTLIRATPLKQKPLLDAATVSELPANSRLNIVARKGAWMQVKTASGQSGWVKLLNVRTGSAGSGGGGGLGTLGKVITTGSSGTTVTTGVKGLSAEQIENAKPNFAELDKLKQYQVSSGSATSSARQAGLGAQSVPYVAYTRGSASGSNTDATSPMNRRP
ncbi:SH3 domain-containing protein [Chitinolyticbacter albus]|uniref:SH3 domain-containing protein n=1 Tax=Chitinolyticbacter albus TaxID=2961951 RepID=UPI00210BFBC9|nr:SH3 domain-containing protein [Chitinolyticbacter albus]